MVSSNLICVSVLLLAVTYLDAAPANKRRENTVFTKTTKQLKVKTMPKDQFKKLQETVENVEVATPKALTQKGASAAETVNKPSDKQDVELHGLISTSEQTAQDAPKLLEKTEKKDVQNMDVAKPKLLPELDNTMPIADDLEISPRAAAEYLLATGDFDSYYAAIDQLVNNHMLTREGADNYNAEVSAEVQVLTRLLMDAENAYLQALFPPQGSRLVQEEEEERRPEPEETVARPEAVVYGENGDDSAYNGGIDDPATMELLQEMMEQYAKDRNIQPVDWSSSDVAYFKEQQSPKSDDKVEQQIEALAHASMNSASKTHVKEMSS